KKYPCPNPNCTSVFKEKRHLGTHINYHCGKPPRFQCPYCEYMSHMKCNVKTHCKKRHSDQEIWVVERYSSRVPGNFPCLNGNCGSAFKDELHLRKHLKTCGAPPRFKCTYCDHSSKWSSDMRKHVQVVHPGSEFHCPNKNCTKVFNWRSNLTRHMKYECGKSPRFRCSRC
ncbi:GSCOCG00002834001-RA-CDS, partial [Cotesia congregata]